ncbi:MAG: hypothetical protein AAGC44_05275 [Planctomycetota bacterium]
MTIKTAIALNTLAGSIQPNELKAARAKIKEGTTAHVELTAAIRGTLTRGEGYQVKPTVRLLNKAILAELLRRLGVTREAFKAHLLEIATEAIANHTTTAKQLEDANPQLLLALKEVETDILDKLPKADRAGAIKTATVLELTGVEVQ